MPANLHVVETAARGDESYAGGLLDEEHGLGHRQTVLHTQARTQPIGNLKYTLLLSMVYKYSVFCILYNV